MTLCDLGERGAFGRDYLNYEQKGYDVEALTKRVEELLHEVSPELIWSPATSSMDVEAEDLREARKKYDVDAIAKTMEGLWEKAAAEQAAGFSDAHKALLDELDRAGNWEICGKIFREIERLKEDGRL